MSRDIKQSSGHDHDSVDPSEGQLKVVKIQLKLAKDHANRGSMYAQQQQWPDAIACYEKAIAIDPKFAGAYRNLARVFAKTGQQDEATECWYQALTLEPNWAKAEEHVKLGHRLWSLGKPDQAITCYRQAIELKPNLLQVYYRLGEILQSQGKMEDAIALYQQAVENNPRNHQAMNYYRQLVDSNPNPSPKDYHQLGQLLRGQSRFKEAIESYQKAIELDPCFKRAYVDLQYTWIESEQLGQLITFYRQCIEREPDFPLAWGNLGDVLTEQGQLEEAISCYQTSAYKKAVASNPNLAEVDWKPKKEHGPDFVIIGAARSGTSSLYMYLSRYPQIISPHKKELNFFSKYYNQGIDWYLAHFPSITDTPNFLAGEASPNYFDCTESAQRMFQFFPNVKLIVLLRNPVDRAISCYYHNFYHGREKRSLEDALDLEKQRLETLTESELLQIGYRHPNNLLGSLYVYKLKRWMEIFPREQFLIVKSEDFYSNPKTVMSTIIEFLGLSDQKFFQYPKCNGRSYTPISQELRQTLSDFFQPHNQKLEEYLGIKFNWN